MEQSNFALLAVYNLGSEAEASVLFDKYYHAVLPFDMLN